MVSAKKRASEVHFVTGSDEAAVRKAAVELAKDLAPDALKASPVRSKSSARFLNRDFPKASAFF